MPEPIRFDTRLDLFRAMPAGTVGAEIGVLRGELTEQLLKLPIARLYLVDAWKSYPEYNDGINSQDQEENLRQTLSRIAPHGDRAVIVRGMSSEVARQDTTIPALDWVYIDCNHAYEFVLEDLRLWSNRLKPGGIIMGHDYFDTGIAESLNFGVIRAVTQFCQETAWKLTALDREQYPSYRLERSS